MATAQKKGSAQKLWDENFVPKIDGRLKIEVIAALKKPNGREEVRAFLDSVAHRTPKRTLNPPDKDHRNEWISTDYPSGWHERNKLVWDNWASGENGAQFVAGGWMADDLLLTEDTEDTEDTEGGVGEMLSKALRSLMRFVTAGTTSRDRRTLGSDALNAVESYLEVRDVLPAIGPADEDACWTLPIWKCDIHKAKKISSETLRKELGDTSRYRNVTYRKAEIHKLHCPPDLWEKYRRP